MKKTFSCRLCALLIGLLLLVAAVATAEAPACPICPPHAFGAIPVQWQLFTDAPVDYQITLDVDEASGLRTYTIENPMDWGLDASALGVWDYAFTQPAASTEDVPAEDNATEAPADGWQRTGDSQQVTLHLSDAAYQELGFPAWTAPCANGADTLRLMVYLGQLRHLYASVDYSFGSDSISIYAKDHSFTISMSQTGQDGSVASTYASYDPNGILAYANHSQWNSDNSFTSYTLEAHMLKQCYQVSSISHIDPEGNIIYWEAGQWTNDQYEPVNAPAGIDPEKLPFTLVGEWVGVPFAEPGDLPSGTLPTATLPQATALSLMEYQPWPAEGGLFRTFTSIPQMPQVAWDTAEDGNIHFTVTGLENCGIQPDHLTDWVFQPDTYQWEQSSESTGQLRLICPPEEAASALIWEQETTQPGTLFQLCLNLQTQTVDAGLLTGQDSYWLFSNNGSVSLCYPLSETQTVEAYYDNYALLEYNLHTADAEGNRLTQACYNPSETDPDRFELACFFCYSQQTEYEALWIKDVGWYSYLTGEPCDTPEGVDLAAFPPLPLH